jgi:hypothetical protein
MAVDVIVDRDDDVGDLHAIYRHAREHPNALAVSISPDARSAPAVVWAILRALGKRRNRLGRNTPDWRDVTRWLAAHEITKLIVMRADHLTATAEAELLSAADRACVRSLTLVYHVHADTCRRETTNIQLLLRKPPVEVTVQNRPAWP